MSGIITATAITLDQDGGGTGEARFPVGVPPIAQAITHKFTGVMAGADLNVTDILFFVIETVRDDDPSRTAGEIMVIGQQGGERIQMPCPIKIAQVFLFLRIHTENGVARRSVFSRQSGNVLKLCIAVRNISFHRAFLLGFAPPISVFLE